MDIRELTVADVMQEDVVTAAPDLTVARLLEKEDFTGVPVVGPDGPLPRLPASLPRSKLGTRAVRDIMTPATFSVRPEASLVELTRFLVQGGMHRALVLDDSALVGIVSSMDVVRAVARAGVPA